MTLHPDFQQMALNDHKRELDRSMEMALLRQAPAADTTPVLNEAVVLRLCSVHDDAMLDRLAELEGRPAPKGRHVVAEVSGTIVAALPLGRGVLLADPFRATAHLIPLLELRASQIGHDREHRSRFGIREALRALTPAGR
jgi:hypothetical protein